MNMSVAAKCGALSLMLAGIAAAQQETPEVGEAPPTSAFANSTDEALTRDKLDESWKLRVEPGVWYLGLGGDLRMPGGTEAGNGEKIVVDELGIDSPNIVPTAEAHVFFGPVYRATIRGAMNSEDQTNVIGRDGQIGDVLFSPTSQLKTAWDLSTFELEVGARVFTSESKFRSQAGLIPFSSDIAVFAGVQVVDFSVDISRAAGVGIAPAGGDDNTSYDNTWFMPRIGTKGSIRLYEEFTVDLTLAVASMPLGDSSATAFDIVAGFTWEPMKNFGVQIGYRATELVLSDGNSPNEFEFTGGNQGLQFGVVFKF